MTINNGKEQIIDTHAGDNSTGCRTDSVGSADIVRRQIRLEVRDEADGVNVCTGKVVNGEVGVDSAT